MSVNLGHDTTHSFSSLQLRVVRIVAVLGGLLQIFLFMCLCGITASVCPHFNQHCVLHIYCEKKYFKRTCYPIGVSNFHTLDWVFEVVLCFWGYGIIPCAPHGSQAGLSLAILLYETSVN